MWKAIIKLIEKWAYRCDHNWELAEKKNILDREMYEKGIEINARTEYLYRCTKCMESKKISQHYTQRIGI